MLLREHIEFIHALNPDVKPREEWGHPFSSLYQLTGGRSTSEHYYKIYNATIGWAPHADCDEAMIKRAYDVWLAIREMIKQPCHFTCEYLHYSGGGINWSVAVMINFANLDDYETALTIMKLTSLDRTRMHF